MANKPLSPIDVNTADKKELVKKLGISPRLADRIIALRPYQSVDQLKKVWGIDPGTLQRIVLAAVVSQPEIPPELSLERIPNPPEINPLKENVQEQPAASPQSASIKKEELLPANEFEEPVIQPAIHMLPKVIKTSWKTSLVLVLILLVGGYFRFTGLNWDQNHHQHPDERFISMTADQIRGVSGIEAYFDTQSSTLNPLNYGSYTYGMFPLFLTHLVADWLKMSNYNSLTLVGRAISGLFDLAAVWMLFLLGKRLYNRRVGLLAAALGAAAVLPIQLSHYFTVDSFSTVFVIAAFYFAILAIPINLPEQKLSRSNLIYFGLFGFIVGLAAACKINTLPVFGIIILAGIAKLLTNWKKTGFRHLWGIILFGWALAGFFAFLSFRIFQPYAFSGPGFFGISLNQNWLKIIQEVTNQVAGNSDWPPNTHWTDRSIFYAWTNMVTWGLGIPLGLAGWLGWGWAAWRIWKGDWRRHLLPFVWVGAYFFWQNAQFWRYMRYFMPIYPFIILFAAWALMEIFERTRESRARLLANGTRLILQFSEWRRTWKGAAVIIALGIVLIGTFIYAFAFSGIYNRPMTRIAASKWMLANISGPLNVIVDFPGGNQSYPVSIGDQQVVAPGGAASTNVTILQNGTTSKITTADIRLVGMDFYFNLAKDESDTEIITQGRLIINDDDQNQSQEISFGDLNLISGETYFFYYSLQNSSKFSLSNVTFQNSDGSDSSLSIDLNLGSQAPGEQHGSIPITADKPITINRLEIGNYHQEFLPSETTLKVSLNEEGNENNPLGEASQTLIFTQPGMQFSPTFNFSPLMSVQIKSIE